MQTAQERLEQDYAPIRACKSAKQIADFLEAAKIKGDRADPDSCPLAMYLKKKYRAWSSIDINTSVPPAIEVTNARGSTGKILLSKAAEKFVDKFDNGDYPQIERL